MKMKSRFRFNLLVIGLLLSALLTACGGSATNTPVAPVNTPAPVATAPNIAPTANTGQTPVSAPTTAAPVATTAAAVATTAPAVKKGGNLTTAYSSDIKTLHPLKTQALQSFDYVEYMFNAKLIKRDPKTLEVVGRAAQSWTLDRESATVTFKLKPNIKWSDGKPITAEDYVWTWQQAIKKENGWPSAASAVYVSDKPLPNAIKEFVAVDAQTIKITMGSLIFNIIEEADKIQPLPKHIWDGKDWNDPTKNPEIDSPSVFSGPWKFKEWVRDNRFVVTRNDASTIWPVPNYETITNLVIPNASVQFQKLKSGELDFLSPALQDVAEMEGISSLTTYKWQRAATIFDYIGFNFRRSYIQDRNFRQALMWTLDKKGLIEKVVFNLGVPVYSEVMPVSIFYNDKVEKYGYDPERAKKILLDAGYKIEGGKLIDPKGQAIPKLKLLHSVPSPVREKTAAVLQEEWKKLGLEIEVITADNATTIANLQKEPYDYDMWMGNWFFGSDLNPENFGNAIWANIPTSNRGAYINEEVNKLYNDALKELDVAKRKDIMFKIQEIEARELPYLYYYSQLGYLGVNKRVGGVATSPIGVGYNLYTDWFLKE
jgi:peptide/nickel transport system substrate-binding protein